MGCASSKHLKKQASMDGWSSPPARTTSPSANTITTDYSIEYYNRHSIALTSSSYGLLKVASAMSTEVRKNHDRGRVGSLNEMYGKLRSLEMAESAHIKPWCEVTGMLDMPKPCLDKSISSPPAFGPAHGWRMDSTEFVVSETIHVGDMMRGLEEKSPMAGPSPAKRALSIAAAPAQAQALVSSQHNKKLEKSYHTVEEVDDVKNSSMVTHDELDEDDDEFGKENTMPHHDQPKSARSRSPAPMAQISQPLRREGSVSIMVTRERGFPSKDAVIMAPPPKSAMSTRIPLVNTPLSQISQPLRRESIVSRKVTRKRGLPSEDSVIIKSGPHLSVTPAMTQAMEYAESNGKVKLTLHTQHQNKPSATHTPSSMPSRSMSRRVVIDRSIPSTEPSGPLFDPDLVASYEKALENLSEDDWNACHEAADKRRHQTASAVHKELSQPLFWSSKSMLDRKLYDPFECFEEKCPPGGDKTLVLYTTTLRGIRKTFEDCNTVRGILQSFGLSIDERDVSMHLEFLNELRELMARVASVPRMFIKGRYIGGIEEVTKLYQDGKLNELVEGLPKEVNGGNCDGCGGVRFVPCLECSGSCKVRNEGNKVVRCSDCNENGLIQCPICT